MAAAAVRLRAVGFDRRNPIAPSLSQHIDRARNALSSGIVTPALDWQSAGRTEGGYSLGLILVFSLECIEN